MKIKKIFKILGAGVITGAADDDPSGIATYSQTGAQFGYGMLWSALFILPVQIAIQEACARIGAVTGLGIAAVIKKNYSRPILFFVVFLILFANIINIGADIGAMAESTQLIIPIPFVILTMLYTIIILFLEILIPYKVYVNILKWACLSLLAYPLTLFLINAPWITIIKATFVPHIQFHFAFLLIFIGVLGTTISPYLFFWQASEEVEEFKMKRMNKPKFVIGSKSIRNLRIDNFIGMSLSQITTWSIIVVTATILNTHGINDIKTAADAAKALEPFVHTFPHSGFLAKIIFAIGILGLGFIAIPVLAGSAAYALGEACQWKVGLNLKFKQAHGFYGVIIISTLIGLLINFIGINPIKALIYAAIINGIVAVPLIFIIGLIIKDENIMGKFKSGILSNFFVWLTFISMALAVFATLGSFLINL